VKEAVALAGGLVAVIVIFTLLGGGKLSLGTSSTSGPYATFGFQGPVAR
jgi:hypothetical protein